MIFSGSLSILLGSSQIASCNVGQEVTVFGLVFINTTNAQKTVTLNHYRQLAGAAVQIPVPLAPNQRFVWEKPIALQPGDHVDLFADAVGVTAVWTADLDTGANPVLTGFTVRGVWAAGTPYNANDVVTRNGSSYAAIANTTGEDPATTPAKWLLMFDGAGVNAAVAGVVDNAPANMNTLNKISAALGNDPNFVTTVANELLAKADKAALATVATSGKFADLVDRNKLAIRRLFIRS